MPRSAGAGLSQSAGNRARTMTVNPYSQPSVVVEHESGTGVLSPGVSPITCP